MKKIYLTPMLLTWDPDEPTPTPTDSGDGSSHGHFGTDSTNPLEEPDNEGE